VLSLLVSHIVVDALDEDASVEQAVKSILSERCKPVFNSEELKLSTYLCGNSVVHAYRVAETLLLDLLGAEDLFNELLRVLPRRYLMIRLLERGMPVE